MRYPFVILGLLTIAACGGGGGASDDFPAFADPDSQDSATLSGGVLTSATRSTTGQTGTLDRAGDSFSLGPLSGEINAERSEVTLTGGGTVLFDPAGNLFSTRFTATPQGGEVVQGVVGIVTPGSELPNSGTVTYTGTSVVTIQDDFTLYDLTGAATVAASFGAGTVSTTVDGLSGTATEGLANPISVSNVGTISFTGSTISGASYSDGTAAVTSTTLSGLTGSAQSSLDGAFFGPDATETGGAFIIDDSASGSLTIFGDFIAQ